MVAKQIRLAVPEPKEEVKDEEQMEEAEEGDDEKEEGKGGASSSKGGGKKGGGKKKQQNYHRPAKMRYKEKIENKKWSEMVANVKDCWVGGVGLRDAVMVSCNYEMP